MISAVVWVPALFFLLANRVPDSTSVIGIDTSIFQIINSLFWGISYNINGKYSYIYCGLPCIILNVLYFANKDINKKEKLFSTVILSFLFLCMIFTPLNSLLHLFDQPDDFWYRYSYLISFCVCAISARQLIFMSNITVKKIFAIYGFVMLFYLIMHRSSGLNTLIPDEYTRLNTNPGFIFCSIALLIWCILLRLVYIKRVRNFLMILFSLSLLSVELLSNSKYEVFFKYDYEEYNNWYSNSKRIADELNEKDESLYRTIIVNTLGYCSDTWFDVNGVADFGNQEKYAVRKFLSNIGFATSPRVTMENGYNPVSELILGVKYVIDGHTDNDYVYTKGSIYEEELHENEYYLGMGYLVPGDLITYNYPGRNVFENLNSIVNSLSGLDKDCFKPVDENDISNESYYIFKSEVPDGYFRIDRIGNIGQYGFIVYNHDPNTVYIQFENSEAAFYGSDYVVLETTNAAYGLANLAELSCSNQMKYNPDKNRHETYLYSEIDYCPEEFECSSVNIYYLDKDAFEEQYNELSKNQLEIYEYSRGNIKGKINVTGDKRLLFTSIPYDPAWRAYINGMETETVRVIDGAFMGIYLPNEGDFDIEFAFETPGLKIGRIVSLCGLLALLSVIFEKKLKKKK